jgi:hypothetical protein
MQEFLANNGTALVVFSFVLLTVVALLAPVVVFVVQWRRVRQADIEAALYRAELEVSLKKDMLNKGMSADEIQKVLQASASQRCAPPEFPAVFAEFFNQAAAQGEAGKAGWEALEKNWKEFGKGWKKFGKMWGRGCGWRHECKS